MQIQTHRAYDSEIGTPRINQPDRGDSFAVLPIGPFDFYIHDAAEAVKLLAAADSVYVMLREHATWHAKLAEPANEPYCTTCGGGVKRERGIDGRLKHSEVTELDADHSVTLDWRASAATCPGGC